jgi:hypothetical protein
MYKLVHFKPRQLNSVFHWHYLHYYSSYRKSSIKLSMD